MANIHDVNESLQVQPSVRNLPTLIALSQGENGRSLQFRMVGATIPSGSSASLSGTKPDGVVYSKAGTVDGNTVIFQEDVQLTAVAGAWDAKIHIVNSGNSVATALIRFIIDPDPVAAGAVPSDTQLEGIVAECKLYAEAARSNAYGSPLTASAAADMIDTSKVYVYTGDETGYTAGHWYYYNGTAWADGGVYNSIAIQTDTTLTLPDHAADAKATGDKISDIKEELEDITEPVYSSNIFDQANSTITEGKYLNYNNGNEGTNASYCYVNEYIPVEENTQYYGTTWSKSTGSLSDNYNGFAVFYDANKGYLGGLSGSSSQNPFTTPAGCTYMRISMGISGYNSNNYMFEKGSSASSQFVPYSVTHKLKLPLSIVNINGNGDFTSIASAVNTLPDGSAILVMPGTYEENVKAWSKEVHIIGFDREACVLKDVSGNYSTPPLEIGAGSVQNMTIIERAEGAGTANMGAYAIHVESNNLYNKKLLIRNCYIESDSSSAIGMGLRGGCSVRIEDCEIICAGARASTGAAPIYFHDADAQAYWGTANLYLKNNVLRNTSSSLFSMLTINSIHKENTTYMHVMYNIFVRSSTPSIPQKFNTWNTSGNTDADGWNRLSHMYLTDDSFGNNLSELDYA